MPTAPQKPLLPARRSSAFATASGLGKNNGFTARQFVARNQAPNSTTTTTSWIARTVAVRRRSRSACASIARFAHCVDRMADLVAQQFVALVAHLGKVR